MTKDAKNTLAVKIKIERTSNNISLMNIKKLKIMLRRLVLIYSDFA
jgi:hypothetical protein